MSAGIIVLLILLALVIVIAIWVVSVYNSLVKMRNNVEEGFSTMDVYLKKRYDLIPNFVETVKGYAKHEKETLTQVIAARNAAMNATNADDKLAAEGTLSTVLKQLAVVVEKYPELKADANFSELQNQLKTLESEIAGSRKYYNAVAKIFNVKIEIFPSNIIAKWFKFVKKPLYEIDSSEERKNVKVEF